MEYAFHPLVRLQDPVYGFGQIKSVGWGTYLVGHDFKCALFAPEPSHGLDEVFAIGGVEPSGAYDDAVGGECEKGGFAGALRSAVLRYGVDLVRFLVRSVRHAVEHVIGRHMDYLRSGSVGCVCYVFDGIDVDCRAQGFVLLGTVNRRVGRTIDNVGYFVVGYIIGYCLGVGQIKLLYVGVQGVTRKLGFKHIMHFAT